MPTTFVETFGTVHADGRLELDEKVAVPPGKVKVRVESIEAAATLETCFRERVRQWKEATLLMSSITEMATHPAYQEIIGMGKAVLPLIFAEMVRAPDQWFWALKAITGADPVAAADRGNMRAMTQEWLSWAKANGF